MLKRYALRRRSNGGWEWETVDGYCYRTDWNGCGLWRYMPIAGVWQQVAGTCQFSLPHDRRATLRELRKWCKVAKR